MTIAGSIFARQRMRPISLMRNSVGARAVPLCHVGQHFVRGATTTQAQFRCMPARCVELPSSQHKGAFTSRGAGTHEPIVRMKEAILRPPGAIRPGAHCVGRRLLELELTCAVRVDPTQHSSGPRLASHSLPPPDLKDAGTCNGRSACLIDHLASLPFERNPLVSAGCTTRDLEKQKTSRHHNKFSWHVV